MVRSESKTKSPTTGSPVSGTAGYSYAVLAILILLTVGATFAYDQDVARVGDGSGARWTPVVFLIGLCVSLVIFVMTHRDASARAVLQQKTLDLIEAKKQNDALLVAEQNARVIAERANLAKDEFLAIVSHELRTPLNAIAGWNRILKTDGISPETQKTALSKIEKNLRMQTAIIEELLSFSDIISVGQMDDLRPIKVSDILEEATSAVSVAAFQKGIALEKSNSLADESVAGDRARLKIALVNVLSNAVKFTPPGGSITVKAFKSGEWVKCVVADSGEGIEPEFISHIFEQYRQAETPSTRHHGGLGLGLTIADQIVKLHNGTIEAKSDGLGSGSTFTISIPAQQRVH